MKLLSLLLLGMCSTVPIAGFFFSRPPALTSRGLDGCTDSRVDSGLHLYSRKPMLTATSRPHGWKLLRILTDCGRGAATFRRGGSQLRSGFGEAADRIKQEMKAKEDAEKTLKKKRQNEKKEQDQVKKRMEARQKAEQAKKKRAAEDAARRAAIKVARAGALANAEAPPVAAHLNVEGQRRHGEEEGAVEDEGAVEEEGVVEYVSQHSTSHSIGEEDGDEEEEEGGSKDERGGERAVLSDAGKELIQLVNTLKVEGKSLKLLGLMGNISGVEGGEEGARVAGAIVQALLEGGRGGLAWEAVREAEFRAFRLPSKILVSVAKAVAIEGSSKIDAPSKRTPRAKPHKLRAARQAGMSPSAAWSAASPEEENEEPEFMDDIQRCLEIANILRRRCGEASEAEGSCKEATGQKKTSPIPSIASTARAIARVYAAGVVGLLRVGRLADGRKLLARLTELPESMGGGAYNGLLREFARLQSLQGLLDVLEVMAHFHLEPSAQALELVANVAVHDVEFVKGAVSMETLPAEGIPEACFAGRSNVGKSSLVNMMCNRKKLAFTSKTPGKTQEFNYFLVTGGRGAASSTDARGNKKSSEKKSSGPRHKNVFHLVDLPGVGYAEVPNFKREEWKRFYRSYLLERASLRVIFQLVDGRHGALKDDLELADLIQQARNARAAASPPPQPGASRQQASGGGGGGGDSMRRGEAVESLGVFEHVVVVTKMDKRESKSDARLLNDLRQHFGSLSARLSASEGGDAAQDIALSASAPHHIPIILTSSVSKLGRGEMWRYLRLAAGMGPEEDVVEVEGESDKGRGSEKRRAAAPKKYTKGEKFKGLGRLLRKIEGK